MQHDLTKHIDLLLKIALQKCADPHEAQDLCQETLVSALVCLRAGKEIDDMRAWLLAVLTRKFYDSLRRKYNKPTVSFDLLSEAMGAGEAYDEVARWDEAEELEELRLQIAYLANIHREVIIRHYLNGENVEQISKALHIPSGTVKSRLSNGRTQIKKGFQYMENYSRNSYEPQSLYVGISGTQSVYGGPQNITDHDLIAQNLLILAYKEPVTELELAKAIGIPMAYIEGIIETLVENELMKRVRNKVYTDFILYSHKDIANSIQLQREWISNNFNALWEPIGMGLERVKKTELYARQSKRQKAKLAYYFLMHTLSACFFGTGGLIYDSNHDYPDRPDGGKWIGMGYSYPRDFDHENSEFHKYSWSGERSNYLYDMLGTKEMELHVFDTPLEARRYYHTKHNLKDDGIAQMLYVIHEGISPSETGINPLFFENVPYLKECGVLSAENGEIVVDIPILTKKELGEMSAISLEVAEHFIPLCLPLLTAHLKRAGRAELPKHLTGVPEEKQYLQGMQCLHMFMIYTAKEKGYILNDVDFPCPPMLLAVEK